MSILSKGTTFSTGDQVTATNLNALVDSATFAAGAVDDSTTALDSSSPQKIIVKNGGINTTQLADSSNKTTGVTFAKMQHVSTDKVLGRTSDSEGDVEEVSIVIGGSGDDGVLFDNDDMLDNDDTAGGSAARGATQQSIKAYVDASSTDGFTPTSYSGGESVTLPNGLIMKMGLTASVSADSSLAVSFGSAFPNAVISVVLTKKVALQTSGQGELTANSVSTSGFTIRNGQDSAGQVFFQAIGH
jgi:hypothetical protein